MSADKKDTGFAGLEGLTSDKSSPARPLVQPKEDAATSQTLAKQEWSSDSQQAPSDIQSPSAKSDNASKYRILSIILGVVCLILVVLLIRSCAGSNSNPRSSASIAEVPAASAPAASVVTAPAASAPAASTSMVQEQQQITPAKPYRSSQLSDDFAGEYHTSKHSIRIIQTAGGKYIYTAWKQPYVMDEDKPTLMLTNGEYNPISDAIEFRKGNLELNINRNKELFIYINGVYRDHYYMYRD